MKRIAYIILGILVFASLMSCTPQLSRPDISMPSSYAYGDSNDSLRLSLRWWESFEDSTLNQVVDIALNRNRDLAAALSRVEAARVYIKEANAEFLPSLSLGTEAEAERTNGATTKQFELLPTLKWEISLFGKRRNTRSSALSSYLASEWGYRAAMLSLTSEVATTLFTLSQYERSYSIAKESYELRQEATALVDSMFHHGMSDGVVLAQAKSLVFSAEIEVVKYRRALAQSRVALGVLLGDTTLRKIPIQRADLRLPPQIPAGLPSSLLERRPDILQSYYTMQSAAAEVGVARAERLPSITLTAEGGVITETLKDLTSAKPIGWSIAGEVAQPIFNFGRLRSAEEAAKSRYEAAMHDYEQSILEALRDVEDALLSISTFREESERTTSLVEANTKIAHMTRALYKSGLGDYLSVIDAERELYSSQIDLTQLRTQQLLNYVSLCKALGGGYYEPKERAQK